MRQIPNSSEIDVSTEETDIFTQHGDVSEMTSDNLQIPNLPQATDVEESSGESVSQNFQREVTQNNNSTTEKNESAGMPSVSSQDSSSEKQGNENTPPKTTTRNTETTQQSEPEPTMTSRIDNLLNISLAEWLSRSDVVWGTQDYKGKGISGKIPLGTTRISNQLQSLINKYSSDCVYAVMVDFSSCIDDSEMKQWEYNGNTIASLQDKLDILLSSSEESQTYIITDSEGNEEISYLPVMPNKEEIAEIKQKMYSIRKAFLETKLQSFKDSFHRQGLEIYADTEGGVVDNLVFYTFATKAKLTNFFCKSSEAFVFLPAYEIK